jgi:hypothetical protein
VACENYLSISRAFSSGGTRQGFFICCLISASALPSEEHKFWRSIPIEIAFATHMHFKCKAEICAKRNKKVEHS